MVLLLPLGSCNNEIIVILLVKIVALYVRFVIIKIVIGTLCLLKIEAKPEVVEENLYIPSFFSKQNL